MTKTKISYAVEWQKSNGTWGRYASTRENESQAREYYRWLTKQCGPREAHRIIEIISTERILPNRKRATPKQAKEGFDKMREACR